MASTDKNTTTSPSKFKKFFKRLGIAFSGILVLIPILYLAWHNIDSFEPDMSKLEMKEVDTSAKGNGYYDLIFKKEDFWYGDYKNSRGRSGIPELYLEIEEDFNPPSVFFITYSYQPIDIQDARTLIEKNRSIINRIFKAANSDRIQAPIYDQPFNEIKLIGSNLRQCADLLEYKTWVHLYDQDHQEAFDSAQILWNLSLKILEGTSDLMDAYMTFFLLDRANHLIAQCSLVQDAPRERIEQSLELLANLPDLRRLLIEDLKFRFDIFRQTIEYIETVQSNPLAERTSYELDDFFKESSLLPNETLKPVANYLSEFLDAIEEQKTIPPKLKRKPVRVEYSEARKLAESNKYFRGRNAAGKYLLVSNPASSASHNFSEVAPYERNIYLSQIKLALLLYYFDNNSLPDQLVNLTPKYLKSIPKDPVTQQKFHYIKDQRVVYSLGMENENNGGNQVEYSSQFYFKGQFQNVPIENPNNPLPERNFHIYQNRGNPTIFLEFPGMQPLEKREYLVIDDDKNRYVSKQRKRKSSRRKKKVKK